MSFSPQRRHDGEIVQTALDIFAEGLSSNLDSFEYVVGAAPSQVRASRFAQEFQSILKQYLTRGKCLLRASLRQKETRPSTPRSVEKRTAQANFAPEETLADPDEPVRVELLERAFCGLRGWVGLAVAFAESPEAGAATATAEVDS